MGLLIGGLSCFWAGQLAGSRVQAVLDSRLTDAGAAANAGTVLLESDQLALVRAVSFTQNVPSLLAARNASGLEQLVAPLQANAGIPIVDVVDTSGNVVLAVRGDNAPAPVATRANWIIVQEVLRGYNDQFGERLTDLILSSEGPLLATAGPVVQDNQIVGAVVVATPLSDELGQLANLSAVDLTVYSPAGVTLSTSLQKTPPNLDPGFASALVASESSPVGQSEPRNGKAYREMLGRLIVRHRSVAVLETELPDSASAAARIVTIQVAVTLAATMLALGTLIVRLFRGLPR